MEQFLNLDWSQTRDRLMQLVQDPRSNIVASALLLAAFAIVVLLVVLAIGVFLFGRSDEDDEWYEEGYEGSQDESPASPVVAVAAEAVVEEPKKPLLVRLGWASLWTGFVIAVAWIAIGVTTAQSPVCLSCHTTSVHAKATYDPHENVGCASCHEKGGFIGSVTTAVPSRGLHFLTSVMKRKPIDDYGQSVASDGCLRCHAKGIRPTLIAKSRGIRISHKEPLAAGAKCLDCHALAGGSVSGDTVGMAPCLRCHDGVQASTECDLCHTKPAVTVATPGQAPANAAKDRIGQPNCGLCHDERTCDNCHGYRMPHSKEFMAFGHAREAALDIWNTGGQKCKKCHTAARRPCEGCHVGTFPQHPVPLWRTIHGGGGPTNNACICHDRMAYISSRNFCGVCHEQWRNF